MGMQQDADTADYPAVMDGGAARAVVPSPCGPGGNACLINQDEAEIIEASYEYTPVVVPAQLSATEDFSSVNPMFREQAL